MSEIYKAPNANDLPPSVPTSFVTDSGTAVPVANVLNILTGLLTDNSGSTVLFTGSGNTVELNVTDANFNTIIGKNAGNASLAQEFNTGLGYQAMDLLISGGTNTAIGANALSSATQCSGNTAIGSNAMAAFNYTTIPEPDYCTAVGANCMQNATAGFQCTAVGASALASNTTGQSNCGFGVNALALNQNGGSNCAFGTGSLQTGTAIAFCTAMGLNSLAKCTGSTNSVLGYIAGQSITSGSNNVCVGDNTISAAASSTGSQNTAIGSQSLKNLGNGSNNCCLGYQSGGNYTTTETNNICIGFGVLGTAAESNVIRLGNASHNKAFITGIDGVNVGSVATVVTEASNQLGTAVLTAGTGITITPTANTITIAASGTTNITYTAVTHAASPYTVLTTDDFLGCQTSGGVITVKLPNAPATGKVYTIKDSNGAAATSNISVTTVGGTVTIDGQTTYTIATNYGSINVLFDGSNYEVY